jgi:hypothetical protein
MVQCAVAADNLADHCGILSWHAQPHDKKLREAGSYGYLVQAMLPAETLAAAAQTKKIVIRLEVDSALPGGPAVYGERFSHVRWGDGFERHGIIKSAHPILSHS